MAVNLTSRNIARLAGKFCVAESHDMQIALGVLAIEGNEAVLRTGLRGRPIRLNAEDIAFLSLAEKHPDAVIVPARVSLTKV